MNDVDRMMEKLGLAIHGEEPELVLNVLVHLVASLCAEWHVNPQQFVMALMSGSFDPAMALVPLRQEKS